MKQQITMALKLVSQEVKSNPTVLKNELGKYYALPLLSLQNIILEKLYSLKVVCNNATHFKNKNICKGPQ